MYMTDDLPKRHGRHRTIVESDIIKRREREFKHQNMWTGTKNYYSHFGKINTKFDEWTSPEYYEHNNKMLEQLRKKRNEEELLEKRRENLKRLLAEEQKSYEIEIIVKKSRGAREKPPFQKPDDIPIQVLKDVNFELKQKREQKKKRQAELQLYHQWKINNPIVRQYESKYRFEDVKLAWLDQQIEKRMQKENEEQKIKSFVKEQEEKLKKEAEKGKIRRTEIAEKRDRLKKNLEKQMEELREKQKVSKKLQIEEQMEVKRQAELEDLLEKEKIEEKRRRDREFALFNIKQHKLKLKQKASDIQENLLKDKEFTTRLKQLELKDLVKDGRKKKEIKEGLDKFLNLLGEHQELEKRRQRHLQFLFDSEAKAVYEKQSEVWTREEMARKSLLNDVLDTIKKQVQENLEKNKQKQLKILQEREEMMKAIESYDEVLKKIKIDEEKQQMENKKLLDQTLKLKNARRKQEECFQLKEIDVELQRVKKEEERLQKEILEIQRRQGPYRPQRRTRMFY